MPDSKAPQSLEKSILNDLVNWKWDLMQFLSTIQVHPSPIIKESYHVLFPLTSLWSLVCFLTDSNYKIRINSPWHAESLFILICVVFKEGNSSAHSLQLGWYLKFGHTWCNVHSLLFSSRSPVRGACDLASELSWQICSLMNNTLEGTGISVSISVHATNNL